MKERFFLYQKKNFFLSIIFFLIILIKLKFFYGGFWYDEWHTFFYSNPSFLSSENFYKLVNNATAPPLYFVILSLFNKIFGYSPEVGRAFSLLCDLLSFFTLYLLLKKNFVEKVNFFILLFFLLNYSIILYSIELRFYSFYILVTLINVYFFFNYLNQKKKINLFKYFFFSLFALSSNYFILPIIAVQFLYFFLKSRLFFYFILFFSVTFVGINFPHLSIINDINSQKLWGSININFFVGYYFNIFFGSKILGGLILLSIISIFVLNFKKIKSNEKLLLFILFIICTYLFLIFYSLIFTPVLRPRYLIHLVPLILCVFVILIFSIQIKKIKRLLLTFFCLAHFITLTFFSLPFEKPDTNKLLKILKNQNLPIVVEDFKYIYITQNKNLTDLSERNYMYLYFINHLINLKDYKNTDLIFISKKDPYKYNLFQEICENNPDYQTSVTGDNPDCLVNNHQKYNYEIIKSIRTRDYVVNIYQKKF